MPVSIGDSHGYHASPTISPDGEWVFFAHHPSARGHPTAHEAKAYAQIYRVHADGTGLEALTSGNGCHMSPTVSSTGDSLTSTRTATAAVVRASKGSSDGSRRTSTCPRERKHLMQLSPTTNDQ